MLLKQWLILASIFLSCSLHATERLLALVRLQAAYPCHIKEVLENDIVWADGTCMPIGDSDQTKTMCDKLNEPSLADQLEQSSYRLGKPTHDPHDDPGRIRYEPFFRKMYGDSPQAVEKNLEEVVWMPRIFGDDAPVLRVTRINTIHAKIQKISEELEDLVFQHPEYVNFLEHPGGTYCWRTIANTSRLSNHSFGMTLDINAFQSQYWQWDLKSENRNISEDALLMYRNTVPWEIVKIFEQHGFIWGGKWYHYDTMHFEYRPELMVEH